MLVALAFGCAEEEFGSVGRSSRSGGANGDPTASSSASGSPKADASGSPQPGASSTPQPGASGTPNPDASGATASPGSSPTPSGDEPTASPTAEPSPGSSPDASPTATAAPSFSAVKFKTAGPMTLYLPAPPEVGTLAGFPSTGSLQVLDASGSATLEAGLFNWRSAAESVAFVDSTGLVTALSLSQAPVEIRAVARHDASLVATISVRIRDLAIVDVEIE